MTPPQIHPTAVVSQNAELGEGVVIGPHAIVEGDVSIGRETVIGPHAVIHRYVRMGERNRVSAHAVIGDLGQDISFDGSETWVEIGDENTFREGSTIHRSTKTDVPTRIGSHCFFMVNAHVGHDCEVGNHVILTNNTCLGGHVKMGDRAILGGGAMVHQFCRVGTFSMVAGMVPVRKDALPYCLLGGDPLLHYRLNTIGLRRNGVTGERYRALEEAFRALRAGEELTGVAETPEVEHLKECLAIVGKRGRYGYA